MYHILSQNTWPLTGMSLTLLMTSGLIMWFYFNSKILLYLDLLTNSLVVYQWWWDLVWEGTFQGYCTLIIQKRLWYSTILFIVSDFSWALFSSYCWFRRMLTTDRHSCWSPGQKYDLPKVTLFVKGEGQSVWWMLTPNYLVPSPEAVRGTMLDTDTNHHQNLSAFAQ